MKIKRLFKIYMAFIAVFFMLNSESLHGQTLYIMKTNTYSSGGALYFEYYVKSNGVFINPISTHPISTNERYLIFNQQPTEFSFGDGQPESYTCSGPCGDGWSTGLYYTSINSCSGKLIGGSGGSDSPFNQDPPYIDIISNQVLVQPTLTNTFCDFITLKAEGCTGTQRFFWYYSTDGINYTNTNISTGFNQDFVFSKATYLPVNYTGNIYFKTLIDSDASITGENVFSNIVNYNIIPCSPQIVGSPVLVQNECNNSSNGSATFTFDRNLNAGEYLNLTYKKDGVPDSVLNISSLGANNTYVLLGLGQGVYTDIVFQSVNNGVNGNPTIAGTFTITAPSKVEFSIIKTDIICKDEATGSITVTATGGTAPYEYSKDGGVNWQLSNEFVNLTAGNYNMLVRDGNNCIAPDGSQTVTVIEPNTRVTVASNPVIVEPLLNNENSGNIDITINNGAPPYTFSWSFDNIYNISGATFATTSSEDISNLYAGAYTVLVTDANGCTDTETYTLQNPPLLVPEITVDQNITCNGANNGKLSASATGGRPGYTYQWFKSNPALIFLSSNTQIINLSAGDYKLVVTDADGAGGTKEIFYTLTQPNVLQVTNTITNVSCNGGTDGEIELTTIGGTAPYTFSWKKNGVSISETTATISSQGAGNYSCTVIDQNGCSQSINNLVINENPPIAISLNYITNLLDPAINNGAINHNVSGGTGSYTYLWNTGNTTLNLNNVTAGNYSFTVTDSNGCSATQNYTITAPPPYLLTIQQNSEINCFGDSTASLEAIVSGGTPYSSGNAYQYFWSGSNIPFSEPTDLASISNLPAGTYTVEVRDANNIIRTQTFTVQQPQVLTASFIKNDISCFGANDGTINISTSGGTPNYTYEWKNQQNQIIATTEDVSNLASGIYTCSITDSKGCTITINNIQIIEPSQMAFISETVVPVSTAIATDGSITIVVAGGTLPYSYSWSMNASPIGSNNATLSNIGVGTYTVIITDSKGCSITNTYTVGVIQPLEAAISVLTPINCNGDLVGSLKVSPTGGLPPYTINWSNGGNTPIVSGLGAGTYSVIITDSNIPQGTFSISYNLTEPTPLIIDMVNTTNIICFGTNSGSISIDVSGGTTPYTYEWRNAANTVISNSQNISALGVGNYSCTIRDVNNCTITTASIPITTSPELIATLVSTTNVLINGQATGNIDINVTGGNGSYTYLWNNGNTSQDLSNIPAGTYSVIVTDGLGCQKTINNIVITEPSPLVVTTSTLQNISCYGGNNGQITANVSGAVPPYFYTWNYPNGTISNQATISNLSEGNYTLKVSDQNNATVTLSIALVAPNPLAGSFVSTAVSCGGATDGAITIQPTGGTGSYTYLWNNGETTQTITNVSVGNYVVLVTDSNGCEKLFTGGEVQASGGIVIQETIQDVDCVALNSGSIDLQVTGGSGSFAIQWDNTTLSGFSVTGLSGGLYTGTITDLVSNCIIPFSYTVAQQTPVFFDLEDTITLCQNQSATIDGSATGVNLTYSWTSTNGFTSSSPIITINQSGDYTLVVTSSNGCSYTDTVTIDILSESIESEYLVASQTYKDQEIILINVSESTNENYEWIFPSQAEILSQNSQTAIVKFSDVGVYEIGLKATNSSGCVLYDYNQLIVEENPGLPADDSNSILIKEFKVFPNPINQNDSFNVLVDLAHSLPISIAIYEVSLGTLVNITNFPASKIHTKQYNLNVSSGVYYIVLRTPGNVQTKKIIIN